MKFRKKQKKGELLFDYTILIVGLVIAGVMIKLLSLQQHTIFVATIPLSVGYIIWGTIHHKKHGHVDRKIVMEYVSLAVLLNVMVAVLVF